MVLVPSYMQVEPGSHLLSAAKWPDAPTSTDIDARAVAEDTIQKFNDALTRKDTGSLVGLFLEDGFWRDHLVNSWDLRTLQGREKIRQFLDQSGGGGCRLEKVELDESSAFRAPHVAAFNGGDAKGVEFFTNVESSVGRARGVIRLAEQNGKWMIWSAFFTLQELKGFEEPLGHKRAAGVAHGTDTGRQTWQDRRVESESFATTEPAVLIVGAGQGGLTVAARLKMLGVPALVIDLNDRVGDNWRKRYSQLVLHDPIWFDHMPYLNFPACWPVFTPKDKLAEWFESYAKVLELNVWMRTRLESSTYDDNKKEWTVTLTRTNAKDGTTEKRTFHPRHIIQATGHSGKKNMPAIPGMEDFKGDLLVHSSEFPGARSPTPNNNEDRSQKKKKKKAVVVGACNSAHDICQDYFEHGYDVTMIQRSSTCVVSSDAIVNIGLKGLYEEAGPPVEDADVWLFAYPSAAMKTLQTIVAGAEAQFDSVTLSGLAAAGFVTDLGPDDSGLLMKYWQRGGGYYIDVGASQLIVDGKIKVVSGQDVKCVLPHGLQLATDGTDGTVLDGVDEIVLATGYQNMRDEARSIFGDVVADRLTNSVWGLDAEGEFRTIWRRDSGHPGFWYMGGNLQLCRYFSRVLALQIKAMEEGMIQ